MDYCQLHFNGRVSQICTIQSNLSYKLQQEKPERHLIVFSKKKCRQQTVCGMTAVQEKLYSWQGVNVIQYQTRNDWWLAASLMSKRYCHQCHRFRDCIAQPVDEPWTTCGPPPPHSVAKELLYVALETDLFHYHTAVLSKTVYNIDSSSFSTTDITHFERQTQIPLTFINCRKGNKKRSNFNLNIEVRLKIQQIHVLHA